MTDEEAARPCMAGDEIAAPQADQSKPGLAFWLTSLVLGFVSLLSALEASAIAIVLPRIVTDLHGEEVS